MPFFIKHVKDTQPISFSVRTALSLFHVPVAKHTLHSFPKAIPGTENTSAAQTIKNAHTNVDISYLFRE